MLIPSDGDKVVGFASSEKGAKEIITSKGKGVAQLPPMKINRQEDFKRLLR